MPSRQLPEGWNQQLLLGGMEGKAGQTQAIAALPEACHGMHVAADVEQRRRRLRLRFMAQPEGTESLTGLMRKTLQVTTPVVVATDQADRAAAGCVGADAGMG